MDPRVEQFTHSLQRHWIALAGVGVAALMGGGLGKALTPSLYQDPQPAQLIANPIEPQADLTPVVYARHLPDYVLGTDTTRPQQQPQPLPDNLAYVSAAYAPLETPSAYAHAAEAVAASAVEDANRQEAANVDQAASSDSTEAYPAMAPG